MVSVVITATTSLPCRCGDNSWLRRRQPQARAGVSDLNQRPEQVRTAEPSRSPLHAAESPDDASSCRRAPPQQVRQERRTPSSGASGAPHAEFRFAGSGSARRRDGTGSDRYSAPMCPDRGQPGCGKTSAGRVSAGIVGRAGDSGRDRATGVYRTALRGVLPGGACRPEMGRPRLGVNGRGDDTGGLGGDGWPGESSHHRQERRGEDSDTGTRPTRRLDPL